MEAFYLNVSIDDQSRKYQLGLAGTAKRLGPDGDWGQICDLLSRSIAAEGAGVAGFNRAVREIDAYISEQLADVCVYVEQDQGGPKARRRSALGKLTRDAAKGKFRRLRVSSITSLGSDLKEVVATVQELVGYGITILSMTEDNEVVGPEMATPLGEVLSWSRQLDREQRSAAIKAGQKKVRTKGKRVGRPRRIFDRGEVVRLRDEEHRSWSQVSQALRIGVGTARRAYQDLKASPGPAKTIRGVA